MLIKMKQILGQTSLLILNMNLTLLFMNLSYLGQASSTGLERIEYVNQGMCSPLDQRDILHSVIGCQTRDTLIDLRQHMPNSSNVIQVIPDVAPVKRCGGSCHMYSHRCIPTATRLKRLEVMTVISQFPHRETNIQCGYVEVEEHVGCQCDCPVQAHHCRADQYYSVSGCQCICQDQEERNQCIMRGMQWDPINCMCICPMSSWKVCSTGYIFDFTQTCQCVPMSTTASTGLMAAIIVLMTCMMVTVIGGYVMYKKQVGLFRSRGRRTASHQSFEDEEDPHSCSRAPFWTEKQLHRSLSAVD